METKRLIKIYKYGEELANFLHSEKYEVDWKGTPTPQLRAIVNNYLKKENFTKEEKNHIRTRIWSVMKRLQEKLYR